MFRNVSFNRGVVGGMTKLAKLALFFKIDKNLAHTIVQYEDFIPQLLLSSKLKKTKNELKNELKLNNCYGVAYSHNKKPLLSRI